MGLEEPKWDQLALRSLAITEYWEPRAGLQIMELFLWLKSTHDFKYL